MRLLRKLICFGKGWLPLLSISRGDAVVKEMEKKHIARVDARMDKEREIQVKIEINIKLDKEREK